MPSDAELLDDWRAGRQQAGRELFRRHFPSVSRFFRNKVSQEREDLIQGTFLACVESRDHVRDGGSFRVYVLTVARNQLYRHYLRRQRGAQQLDALTTSVADLGASPSREIMRQEEHDLLLRALRQIPLDLQIALELHYWENLSTAELAEILDIPQGTVKTRLYRARQLLRGFIAELARSPELLESTVGDLEGWARSLREVVEQDELLGELGHSGTESVE